MSIEAAQYFWFITTSTVWQDLLVRTFRHVNTTETVRDSQLLPIDRLLMKDSFPFSFSLPLRCGRSYPAHHLIISMFFTR
jgi:hypothetical protein